MKSIAALLGVTAMALSAGITAANAQNQMGSSGGLANPETVVRNFSVQTVGPVLNELGMPWQVKQLDNGLQYIHAASGSMQFVITFNACEAAGCIGMRTVTFFTGDNFNSQTVQAFNANYSFANSGLGSDGSAYISRYDIADYGIPRGNIASSVANFLAIAQMFAQELANSHQTVSLEGYADDLSASSLNRRSLSHFSGVEESFSLQSKEHRDGFEQGAEMIRMLLKDESAPRNKIENKLD